MEEFANAVVGERRSSATVVTAPVKPVAVRRRSLLILALLVAIACAGLLALRRLRATDELRTVDPIAPVETNATITPASKPSLVSARPARRRSVAPLAPVEQLVEKRRDARGPGKLRLVRYALLSVESDPWGVLYVDDAEIGLTPVTNYQLPLGSHEIRIEQDGYRTKSETILVRSTGRIARNYDLEPRGGR